MSRTPSAPRRSAGSARRALAIPAVLLVAVLAASCGSSSEQAAATSTTPPSTAPSAATGSGTTAPAGGCISRIPGAVLRADEAVVRFDPQQVCPGYVTIAPGTPVTFINQDAQAHTVTITEGSLPDGAVVETTTVEAGGSWARTFDAVGTFTYVTDAIPSFRGAIEVTTGGGMSH